MSPRAKGIVPIAIVVCASVSALVFKGTTEWLVDLFVSACGGLACRLKSSTPEDEEAAHPRPGRARRPAKKPSRNARHRTVRSGIRKPRAHRPARVRLVSERPAGPIEAPSRPEPEAIEVGLGV